MVSRLNAPILIGCTVPVILITKHSNEFGMMGYIYMTDISQKALQHIEGMAICYS